MKRRDKNKVNKARSTLAKAKRKDGAANYGALSADESPSAMRRIKRNGNGVRARDEITVSSHLFRLGRMV